ncbi:polyketide synthase Pks13 [Antrihabitans cavernicola]|uniref:Acyltransferase domain-containing protein n=1 Tax=Antrihabitans cavernicola TaxID=2495913 RepID=A0A5A7SKQ3_9NOCA|nr:polyketide synthase Pks13 [Spelaeibacter cavernicola]KAA0025055.1 acyltransferase domain-containing protein [Spelaeibacter cavernicola]
MTVAELRTWLRNWVAEATGQPAENISDDRPMEEFGLSSRDAIALSGEIEELTGVILTATVVFQHPTIATLATRIIEGEPDVPEDDEDDFYTSAPTTDSHDIAIVGLSTRFPKAGFTPEETWQFLIDGGDGISDLPEGRWDEFKGDPDLAAAMAAGNTRGGYLDDYKSFDTEFFAMSPAESRRVDPQQRLALELAWEALEHARIPASGLKGERVGVYVGTSTSDYAWLALSDRGLNEPALNRAYGLTGNASAVVANRISYFYDFRGPSVAIDTACSSSLVAVHQAVRALRGGEADVALAGGVNALLAPMITLGFDSTGAVAKNGHIKAFSSDADGMVRAEGGGLVVLKRLEDAERDGDNILAVIAGSAVNSDGRSNGLLAPNPDAQADVLRAAYRDAGIAPSGVDYIEAHGTGTILGDPIEADALGRVVGRGRDDDKPALLGSAKTNFGHMESAAGAASLIKVVLAMQENKLPPSLNYVGPNPYIAFDKAHLQVIPEATEWPRYTGKAIAGVSGFGFGGTNAHIVVKEYVSEGSPTAADVTEGAPDSIELVSEGSPAAVEVTEGAPDSADLPVVLAVSAYLPSRRKAAAAALADWLETEEGSNTPLADIGRALAKRNHGRSRAVVLATDHAEAITGLRAVAAGKPGGPTVFSADSPATQPPVWVLSGFGAQHRKMAKQLYQANTVFAAAVDEIDELVLDEAGYSVKEMFLDDAQDYDVGTSQVGIFTIQLALAALLRHHGAEPGAVVGHSLGEVAGAYIAGGLPLEDAVRVICARSRLMGEGESMIRDDDIRRMALVEYSADEIVAVLDDYPDLEVAVYAAPKLTVIGGPEAQVEAITARAESEGKLNRILQTRGAGHTSQMDALLGELAAELAGIEPKKLKVGVYSTVDKETFYRAGHDPIHGVEYWVKNMRHAVYFTNAIKQAVATGHTTFVELAPHPTALMQIAATTFGAGLSDAQLIQTLKRKEDEELGVLLALAQLYVHGHKVNLPSLFEPGDYANIPRTAFIRREHWVNAQIGSSGDTHVPGAHVALPDGRHVWQVQATAVTDLADLVTAAATQVMSDVALGASIPHSAAPTEGTLTTTLNPHPGGASIQVHARDGGSFRLLFDSVVTGGASAATGDVTGAALVEPVVAPVAPIAEQPTGPVETLPEVSESVGGKWNPDGPVTLEDRLTEIVSESMGYAKEDLPQEIPLVELGLDSLMAMRIKNRVEYEFDIPNLQLQAMVEANMTDVGKILRYAVENRDEVEAMAAKQAAEKDTAEKDAEAPVAEAEQGETPTPAAPSGDVPIPPRDAAERLTYATWVAVTGESAKGIFNTLPILDDDKAEQLAARLSERTGGEITVDDVLDSETIEELADVTRKFLEDENKIDGLVRTLRERPEGSNAVPVFVFHPAGGSTVAYEPLLKRLPADTPMYGFERTEGPIETRAAEYVPLIKAIQGDGPYVLFGWSLGGALAYAVARALKADGADVRVVGLLDTVLPGEHVPDTEDEVRKRWKRYAAFARKTYNVDYPVPYDKLAAAKSDEEQIGILMNLLKLSGAKIPAGIIEHQRTSWLDNRAIQTAELEPYDGKVVLYMADTYEADQIELEPALKTRKPDGGWGDAAKDLEVIKIGGTHIAVVDEPYIAKVGADLTTRLASIKSGDSA